MPNRIPTPGIKAPTVRKSPAATPAAKPSAKPTVKYPKQDGSDRPAVGNDKAFAKKYGKNSWNNGYTN